MDDEMFEKAEEDLHEFYKQRNKVDSNMSYRRKLSLNLMTADFLYLNEKLGYDNIMVMLGIDEHKYVLFAEEVAKKAFPSVLISAIYSGMITGFNNYPKMSKSFPESSISVDTQPEEIKDKIMNHEGEYSCPEENVVYQMMTSASTLTRDKLSEYYEYCKDGGKEWERAKEEYSDMLMKILSRW